MPLHIHPGPATDASWTDVNILQARGVLIGQAIAGLGCCDVYGALMQGELWGAEILGPLPERRRVMVLPFPDSARAKLARIFAVGLAGGEDPGAPPPDTAPDAV